MRKNCVALTHLAAERGGWQSAASSRPSREIEIDTFNRSVRWLPNRQFTNRAGNRAMSVSPSIRTQAVSISMVPFPPPSPLPFADYFPSSAHNTQGRSRSQRLRETLLISDIVHKPVSKRPKTALQEHVPHPPPPKKAGPGNHLLPAT